MRKTIISLNLGGLSNAKHFTFNQFTATALTMFAYVSENFAREIAAFMKALEQENKIYEKVDRTFYNQSINEAETKRTLILRKFRDLVKALTIEGAADKVAAAEKVLKVIDLYGGTAIASKPVDAKSGIIMNLVEDMEQKFSEEVELLNLTAVVQSLKTANDRYIQLRSDRTMFDSEDGKGAMAEARSDTDKFYRILISSVNNASELGDYAELADFISYMNIEIERYRISLGQGIPGSGPSGSTEEEEGVRTKKATFKFKNGTTVSFQVEVGAPLEAPANTEGYKWKPAVPEVMPATNKTFTEVPIDPEKFTATFHFADHSEEEITQVAGSELIAPENTTGYVWDPEVPETMPAENTAYYELPEEEQGGDEHEGMFRIDYVFDGEILATQWYHEGDPIVEPEGLLPSGWIWGNTPGVMPARDIIVTAVEED